MTDERIVELLEEILLWTKLGTYPSVETVMKSQFEKSAPEERLAYELLDGTKSQKDVIEICKKSIEEAKISPATLSRLVTKWEKLGLMKKDGYTFTHRFSLSDFNIEVPKVKQSQSVALVEPQQDNS